jgi:hypothetical protein
MMEYVVPIKRIVTKEDLEDFLNSTAYQEYIGYIERLNDSVKNLKIDSDVDVSKVRKFIILSILFLILTVECTSNSQHFRNIIDLGERDSACGKLEIAIW